MLATVARVNSHMEITNQWSLFVVIAYSISWGLIFGLIF
jgi:hypothetical protein